jgi:hypothetical protein
VLRFLAVFVLVWSSPIGLMIAGALAPLIVLGAQGARRVTALIVIAALLSFPALLAVQGTARLFVEQAVLFNCRSTRSTLTSS